MAAEKKMSMTADRPMELYDFLRLRMGLTKRQISQLKFREDGILVDGTRRRVTWKLSPGENVTVLLEDGSRTSAQLRLNPTPIEILYEDDDLCVVNKPAGVATHPGGMHYEDTVANMLMSYFYEKNESLRIRPVGRLDLETSGALMFAKSSAAAGRMAKQREQGLWQKEYLAIAEGSFRNQELDGPCRPESGWNLFRKVDSPEYGWHRLGTNGSEGRILLPLAPDPYDHCRMIISQEGKAAETYYRVVKEYTSGMQKVLPEECILSVQNVLPAERIPERLNLSQSAYTALSVHLKTGRMHQIRCHMAAFGHPLLGDVTYGGSREMIGRAALHARVLTFRQPFSGEQVRVEAPVPEDMRKILDLSLE